MVIDFFRPLAGGGHFFFQTVAGSEKFPCGGVEVGSTNDEFFQ